MRGLFGRMVPGLLILGFLICLAQAVSCVGEGRAETSVCVVQLREVCDAKAAADILAGNRKGDSEIAFAFWGEDRQKVSGQTLGRSAEAPVVRVSGNSGMVLDGSTILDESSRGGCLIGQELSRELFGDRHAQGQIVLIGEERYVVLGILSRADRAILLEADPGAEDVHLDKVSLYIPEGTSATEALRLFYGQTGITGDLLPVTAYRTWAAGVMYLVPVVMLLILIFPLWRKALRQPHGLSRAVNLLVVLLLSVSGIWILNLHISIPREILPTKWSDFEFWSRLWEQKAQELKMLVSVKKSQGELWDFAGLQRTAGWCLTALPLGILGFRKISLVRLYQLWAMTLASIVVSFLFIVLNRGRLIGNEGFRMIWLFVPLCLTVKYAAGKISGPTPARTP